MIATNTWSFKNLSSKKTLYSFQRKVHSRVSIAGVSEDVFNDRSILPKNGHVKSWVLRFTYLLVYSTPWCPRTVDHNCRSLLNIFITCDSLKLKWGKVLLWELIFSEFTLMEWYGWHNSGRKSPVHSCYNNAEQVLNLAVNRCYRRIFLNEKPQLFFWSMPNLLFNFDPQL